MSPKTKTKAETPKTTQTEPIQSESTKIFEKRITGSTYLSPYPTKYNMSSKDWSAALKGVESLMSEGQGKEISINF